MIKRVDIYLKKHLYSREFNLLGVTTRRNVNTPCYLHLGRSIGGMYSDTRVRNVIISRSSNGFFDRVLKSFNLRELGIYSFETVRSASKKSLEIIR